MTAKRVQSYDIYRGLLLAAMVVYHVLLNLTPLIHDARYFEWIPIGFVFFLGVVLARFLQGKTRRKLSLALKILVCFLVLNIPNYLKPAFTLGALIRGGKVIFSFEILLPMALVILASIPLDRVKRLGYPLAGLTFMGTVALSLTGYYSYNLAFLLCGLIGYFLALNADLHGMAMAQKTWHMVLMGPIIILPFALLHFGYYLDFLYIPQVLAAYFLVARLLPENKSLSFLGRNSFVLYIAHIIVIKAIMILTG